MITKFKKIIVGISGGVDSAVAALLLKRKGYDVHGVFMQNWDVIDENGICTSNKDYEDAKVVCDVLNIPLKHVNFVKEYWNNVFEEMITDYQNGLTPNPDVLCNRHIKFNSFWKYARERLGADAIATGHYARTSYGCYLENYNPNIGVKLLQAKDKYKDQTLFLCQIPQEALRTTMFPLGEYYKTDVKEIAKKNGLEVIAKKRESVGICFIGTRDFKSFISQYVVDKPGNFIDIDTGLKVGEHNGFHQWTIGQRAKIGGASDAYFIAKKDVETNDIFVAMGTNHPLFHTSLFFTKTPHWIFAEPPELKNNTTLDCQFKFQHTHKPVNCRIVKSEGRGLVILLFHQKRAIAEGQFAVFFKDEECLGSARISHQGPSNFGLYWLENHKKCKVKYRLMKYYIKEQSNKKD